MTLGEFERLKNNNTFNGWKIQSIRFYDDYTHRVRKHNIRYYD